MRSVMIAIATTMLAATPGAARDGSDVPAATPTGESRNCLPLTLIRETHVRSDQVIDFEVSGGQIYRNTLPRRCPRLGFEERFGYRTSLNQLCSTDIITVLDTSPGVVGPSCGLGRFQPVTLAEETPAVE